MNAKYKRWQCPICNKKCFNTIKDLFVQAILNHNDFKKCDKIEIDEKMRILVKDNAYTTTSTGIEEGFVSQSPCKSKDSSY